MKTEWGLNYGIFSAQCQPSPCCNPQTQSAQQWCRPSLRWASRLQTWWAALKSEIPSKLLWIIMQLSLEAHEMILTCELAWCHPPNPPPPLQGPALSRVWSAFSLVVDPQLCQTTLVTSASIWSLCRTKYARKVCYLRGPRVFLLGCTQLTAPQELLRGDRRHLSISAKYGKGHNINKIFPRCNLCPQYRGEFTE